MERQRGDQTTVGYPFDSVDFGWCRCGRSVRIFNGTAAEGTSLLSVPDGTPMTGTFKPDLSHPFVLSDTNGSTYAHSEAGNFDVPPDPVHFTFAAPSLGTEWDYNGLGFVYLRQTANGQHISFSVAYPKGSGAEITLAGGPGALFQSFGLASVYGGPLNTNESFAHFDQSAGIANDVLVSELMAPLVDE